MERRLPRRAPAWPRGSILSRPGITIVLVAVLAITSGPGVAASSGSMDRTTPATPTIVQTDPIGDLASALEYDVDKIFRFVSDEIRYEPYPGMLRGAEGTLAARAGNSVDKAMLLAALLDKSLIRVRFARGPLDADTTARIVDSLATDLAGARQAALDPLVRGLDQVTAAASPPPDPSDPAGQSDQEEQTLLAEGGQRLGVVHSQLGDTVTMLSDALAGAGITIPSGAGASLPASETDDHTWVEMADGATWTDLDATLAGTQPGSVLTAPAETLDQLPDDLRYGVRFDVLVERAQGGQLVTGSALTDDEFADQLGGVPVMFGHVTPSSLMRLGISINALLGDGWIDYRPTLDIGQRSIVADTAVGFPVAGGGPDIFGSARSPGAGPADGEATAEWLQITVTPPGSQPMITRRTVFDRLPEDVRQGGTPTVDAVEPISLVDLDGSGSADYPPMRGVKAFAIATGPTSAAPLVMGTDDGLGMFALAYHHVRDAMDAEMALDAGARTFIDGPNIVSFSVDLDQGATAPDFERHVRIGLDIWMRSHGVLPLTGSSMTSAQAQLVAGATDHLAERLAIEQFTGAHGAPPGEMGVSAVFEAAAAQGIPTVVLHGSVPATLPYGPEAAGNIKAAMAAGDAVVIPAKPVTMGGTQRIGWWAIDPATGAATDSMDDGRGVEMAERETIVQTRLGQIRCYGALGATIAVELAWVVNVQLLHLRSLNTFSQLRRARQAGLCA